MFWWGWESLKKISFSAYCKGVFVKAKNKKELQKTLDEVSKFDDLVTDELREEMESFLNIFLRIMLTRLISQHSLLLSKRLRLQPKKTKANLPKLKKVMKKQMNWFFKVHDLSCRNFRKRIGSRGKKCFWLYFILFKISLLLFQKR